jgi:hypothetical protein
LPAGTIVLFVDEVSPSCGLATCGNAAFEWEASDRGDTTLRSLSCSCGNQRLPLDPALLLRCDWYRVNAPPLHKLHSGYWSFQICTSPTDRSGRSLPSFQLCYVGTWITGQNTTDVWLPE